MKNFLELLKSRRTCRRFTDEVIDKKSLEYILEAAKLSAAAGYKSDYAKTPKATTPSTMSRESSTSQKSTQYCQS